MKYRYGLTCNSSKLLYAKDLPGIPADMSLLFGNAHIRFYKSRELNGYFHSAFAVPAFSDDEGYVLELDFLSHLDAEENIELDYLAPHNDHTFESLPKAATCTFEDKTEMGQRMLLLNIQIEGTPFNGYVLIPRDLYDVSKE